MKKVRLTRFGAVATDLPSASCCGTCSIVKPVGTMAAASLMVTDASLPLKAQHRPTDAAPCKMCSGPWRVREKIESASEVYVEPVMRAPVEFECK